jgi:hypothetical protein
MSTTRGRWSGLALVSWLLAAAVVLGGGAAAPARADDPIFSNGFETGAFTSWAYISPGSCDDGFWNGDETGIDCGGSCLLCDGDSCGNDPECKSTFCHGGSCTQPSCSDGFQNGDETGIDCGGSCLVCDGGFCNADNECHSSVCNANECQAPTCFDNAKNGNETDVDCGGTCAGCDIGDTCIIDSDCNTPWVSGYAACVSGHCALGGCSGENYDVNGNDVDGCELLDSPTDNHQLANAGSLGSVNCFDGGGVTVQWSGELPSDERTHNPAFSGFTASTGSAPDFSTITGSGGACVNDVSMTLSLTGTSSPTCYRLTVTTDAHAPMTCVGNCNVSCGASCYTDGSQVFFKVERICPLPSPGGEAPVYTVSGHL